MPRGIASQRIAKNRIAGKPIASRYAIENLQAPYQYPPGSHTFTAPVTGYYKFVAWGAGGVGNSGSGGGASGSYVEITRNLRKDATVALVVARLTSGPTVTDTTITFSDGKVVTAGSAAGNVAGAASGGDVNLNGSAGGAAGANNGTAGLGTNGGRGGGTNASLAGGGGAPANLPFKGGDGGGTLDGNLRYAGTPGGGGYESVGDTRIPGVGQVIVYLVRE